MVHPSHAAGTHDLAGSRLRRGHARGHQRARRGCGARRRGSGPEYPADHQRPDAERQSAAADAAPVGTGAGAADLHDRQAGAHFPRPAEYRAGAAVAPHRRRFGRRRHRARRRGQWPHARGARISISSCRIRPVSTATTSWCWWARWPTRMPPPGMPAPQPRTPRPPQRALAARSRASTSAAARAAAGGWSCACPIRVRRSI